MIADDVGDPPLKVTLARYAVAVACVPIDGVSGAEIVTVGASLYLLPLLLI